jgi:hypothetical protein
MMFSMGKCAHSLLGHERFRVGSKKSVQQGRSQIQARSVPFVREHRNLARTPLAAFSTDPLAVTRQVLLEPNSC